MYNNLDCRMVAVLVILILVICFFACDDKTLSSKENNMFLVSLMLVGVILFLIMQNMNEKNELKNMAENFTAPVNYDLTLPTCNVIGRDKLLPNIIIPSPNGIDYQLTEDSTSYNFPTVDGKHNSPRHIFMMAHNKSSPECCPSTFSTSKGCVCLTDEQKQFIGSRGGN